MNKTSIMIDPSGNIHIQPQATPAVQPMEPDRIQAACRELAQVTREQAILDAKDKRLREVIGSAARPGIDIDGCNIKFVASRPRMTFDRNALRRNLLCLGLDENIVDKTIEASYEPKTVADHLVVTLSKTAKRQLEQKIEADLVAWPFTIRREEQPCCRCA